VSVNGRKWKRFDQRTVSLPYDKTPDLAQVRIMLGGAEESPADETPAGWRGTPVMIQPTQVSANLPGFDELASRLREFCRRLDQASQTGSVEAAHAQLALHAIEILRLRQHLLLSGKIQPLPGPAQAAAEKLYVDTAGKLFDGLEKALKANETSSDPARRKLYECWRESSIATRPSGSP
jgi:hypothetical protein